MNIKIVHGLPEQGVDLYVTGDTRVGAFSKEACGARSVEVLCPQGKGASEFDEDVFRESVCGIIKNGMKAGLQKIAFDCDSFVINSAEVSYIKNVLMSGIITATEGDTKDPLPSFTAYLVSKKSRVDEVLAAQLEQYLKTPQKQVVNQAYGETTDPITNRFRTAEETYEKQPRFRDLLVFFIERSKYKKDSEVYKASGISKYTFSKVMSYKTEHKPSKETVGALCIGLKLGMEDAQKLYHSAGYHLGTVDFVDRVIRFFIHEERYNIDDLNFCLGEYGFPPLCGRLRGEQSQR